MSETTGSLAHLTVIEPTDFVSRINREAHNKRADRIDLPLRYSLIVSLRTAAEDVDLYTPIAVRLSRASEGSDRKYLTSDR
jgi:hypothetical protein